MHRVNSPLTAILALGALLLCAVSVSNAEVKDPRDPYPRAAVAYATVLDGELIWGRHLDTPRAPASLTKLLTALVLLDSGWNPNASLGVSHEAAHTTQPRVGLRTGESVIAGDALEAMLMHSANDACQVLAENAAGSLEAFAVRMNARAAQLGMHDSHFVHPCGFDAEGQYSTARDLLRLALAAHANPRIAQIVAQQESSLTTSAGRQLSFRNTNQLLGRLDGVEGLKTGYTSQAGHCLIAVAERAGHRVWLVLLDAQQRWLSAHRIITDAFAAAAKEAHPLYAGS
jgi:D-alanyl-D-alanine carboxypeptidase (penicillin-binding protein 5/6)